MPRQAREIPWLEQRDGGTYYVFWYDKENRRTERFSLRTKDAEEARQSYVVFLQDGKGLYEKQGPSLTVATALDQYELEHVNLKCADAARQRLAIGHLKKHFGSLSFGQIDIDASRRFLKARLDDRRTAASARRELKVLVAAANHARRWKRISVADMPSVEMPADSAAKTDWYTKDEVKLIIDTATGDLKRFVRILYYTGARRRSIETLTVSQIDFASRLITLAKPGERATKKRKPIVELFTEIEADLRALVSEAKNGKLFNDRNFYIPYRQHCEAIGLDHKANPHIMRHTRASLLLQGGTDPWTVAKLLGNSVQMVDSVYGHHRPDRLNLTGGEL